MLPSMNESPKPHVPAGIDEDAAGATSDTTLMPPAGATGVAADAVGVALAVGEAVRVVVAVAVGDGVNVAAGVLVGVAAAATGVVEELSPPAEGGVRSRVIRFPQPDSARAAATATTAGRRTDTRER